MVVSAPANHGVAMAMLFYFVLRGGLLSAGTSAGDISLFGIAAVSGLVGLFSRQAGDKLEELFNTLFRTDRPREEGDRLGDEPIPAITSIEPRSAPIGTDVEITIHGSDFAEEAVVRLDGQDIATSYVSDTLLTARVPASAIPSVGELQLTVVNPSSGGGTTGPRSITLENPEPLITAIDPASVPAESDVDITVRGENFVQGTVARVNGQDVTTTVVSATELTASIPGSAIPSAGAVPMTVFNGPPGGGESSAMALTIQ